MLVLKAVAILAAVLWEASLVSGSAEAMGHVAVGFGKSLEECREESGLSPEIMEEFHHFWREDFEVVHRELGCAIICMSNKFSLLKDDTRIHHMNMDEYIKSFPQGELLAKTMVEMIHNCEKQFEDIEDNCDRVVKVARCFKEDSQKAGIAPEMAMMESILEQY